MASAKMNAMWKHANTMTTIAKSLTAWKAAYIPDLEMATVTRNVTSKLATLMNLTVFLKDHVLLNALLI